MESLITFFVFVVVIIICMIVHKNYKPPTGKHYKLNPDSSLDIKTNGVNINLNKEELDKIEHQLVLEDLERYKIQREALMTKMKKDRETTDDLIRQKVLDKLLSIRIANQVDLNRVKFLYNDGKLRSNEEVESYDKQFIYEKERMNFDQERHKVNFAAFVIPFLSVGLITMIACDDILFGMPLGLLFGLIGGFFGTLIGYKINIDKAKEYGIPDDNPSVQNEKLKHKIGVASGITAGISIYHNTKNTIKDIKNVDSWKEMK